MYVNKRKGAFLKKSIAIWEQEKVIDSRIAQDLNDSLDIVHFDWKKLAKWAFVFAIACFVIAVGSFVASPVFERLLFFLSELFQAGFARIVSSFGLTLGTYFLAFKAISQNRGNIFRNESILFVAVLATAWFICELGIMLDTGSGHFSLLILISFLAYAAAGYFYRSKMVWIFALVALGGWMGAETGYVSGWGMYYLGMNFPLRFLLLGLVMSSAALLLKDHPRISFFFGSTLAVGLLYFFISLWLLSIFGNYGDLNSWYSTKQIEFFHWSLIFAFFALLAMYLGFKEDIRMLRGFGITFFCINLYTRFFEYFWDSTHKAIFFFLLGLSFWILASRAEKAWLKLEETFGKVQDDEEME